MNDLLNNLNKIHTTKLGKIRIKKNLSLEVEDEVKWCCDEIQKRDAKITRKGKNYYVLIDEVIITINGYSYTIITAHKK